jgi:hypothetical protein
VNQRFLRSKNMRAFTIIETMVLVLVFTLVLGAVFSFILLFYRNYDYIFAQSKAVEEARIGIETMVREIREARPGDDGSFPIELAGDKEFVFYSDIDKDGETERVRYFLGSAGSGSQTQSCVSFTKGGSCAVQFSNFLTGTLESAEIQVSVEGDFGWNRECAEVFADGVFLDDICHSGCSDCAGAWQGASTFDITEQAADDFIELVIDATYDVDPFCDWEDQNHSMKAKFEFSFTESLSEEESDFRKGITDPVGFPIGYPDEQEKVIYLSSYVRNVPPIFEYFDGNGAKILEYPARLKDTKLMKVFLVVDTDPASDPPAFELESYVQLRNLKE